MFSCLPKLNCVVAIWGQLSLVIVHCILFDVLLQIAAYLKEKLDIAKIELINGLGKSNASP